MLEESIIKYEESSETFLVFRRGAEVHANYCSLFDKSTSEEMNVHGVFLFEDYKNSIEKLLMFGKASVVQRDSRIVLGIETPELVLMDFYGVTDSVTGVRLSLEPRSFLPYQYLADYAVRVTRDLSVENDSDILSMQVRALIRIGESALDPLRKFVQAFYHESDSQLSHCLANYDAAVHAVKEIEKEM